jgi:UDP-N-acetylmuramate--alanine ligase
MRSVEDLSHGGRRIHLVGVGGSGMNGLAELLVRRGHLVSGSDIAATAVTSRLAGLGVRVFQGHRAEQVHGAQVVAYSSAISPANPELLEARRLGIPTISRGELLAELFNTHLGIAVAGAHGKTTTTSMIAFLLDHAGLDPTAVIGARLSAFGSNVRIGSGPLMVVEADESDGSFLSLSPTLAVVTNIDHEHLDHYGTFGELEAAFVAFAEKVPENGALVMCADDPRVRDVIPRIGRPIVTYGLEEAGADVSGSRVSLEAFSGSCEVTLSDRMLQMSTAITSSPVAALRTDTLRLQVPGRHNLQNALAAIAVGTLCGVSLDRSAAALSLFHAADRRLERRGTVNGVQVVDDYGHHPTEIAAVLDAVRRMADGRLLVAFQPHRYSRTQQLLDDFGPALRGADAIWLTDIYAASEAPIPGVTVDALADAIRRRTTAPVKVVANVGELPRVLADAARPGDTILTIGAGSIASVPDELVHELSRTPHLSRGDKS